MNTNFDSRYLFFTDYIAQIQTGDLLQVLDNRHSAWDASTNFTCDDLSIEAQTTLLDAESIAVAEMKSYLDNRYITDEIFANSQEFSTGTTYYGKNLIQYIEDRFCTGTTYQFGDRFSYNHKIYETVVTGGTSGITPTTTNTNPSSTAYTYNFITNNKTLYYANLPIPEWDNNINYKQNDLVWYKDEIYIAIQNVRGINPHQSQNLELRYGTPSVLSYNSLGTFDNNTYPTVINPVPSKNIGHWALYDTLTTNCYTATSSTYSFSGKTPDNTCYWTKGDNRNSVIKMYLIDILLYHLHARINPRNIPELRNIRYNGGNNDFQGGGAIGWLKNIEKGKISLNAPEKTPQVGLAVRWGSYVKRSNYYSIITLLGLTSFFI